MLLLIVIRSRLLDNSRHRQYTKNIEAAAQGGCSESLDRLDYLNPPPGLFPQDTALLQNKNKVVIRIITQSSPPYPPFLQDN